MANTHPPSVPGNLHYAADDLTGQKFGRLTVLRFSRAVRYTGATALLWLCRCDCGTEKEIRAGNLRSGQSRSCRSCLGNEPSEAMRIMRGAMPGAPDRFLAKIAYDPYGCWIWTGTRRGGDYGAFTVSNRPVGAHRLAAMYAGQIVSSGDRTKMVRHICDNPPCCRPDHLIAGTAKENTADAFDRGRGWSGERQGSAKVTAEDVRAIRAIDVRAVSYRDISVKYGISRGCVNSIRSGYSWKHLL